MPGVFVYATKEALPSYQLESAPHGVAMSIKLFYILILTQGAEFCKCLRLSKMKGAPKLLPLRALLAVLAMTAIS